jgi:hypothetical protein
LYYQVLRYRICDACQLGLIAVIDRQPMNPKHRNGRCWLQMPKSGSRSKRRKTDGEP